MPLLVDDSSLLSLLPLLQETKVNAERARRNVSLYKFRMCYWLEKYNQKTFCHGSATGQT